MLYQVHRMLCFCCEKMRGGRLEGERDVTGQFFWLDSAMAGAVQLMFVCTSVVFMLHRCRLDAVTLDFTMTQVIHTTKIFRGCTQNLCNFAHVTLLILAFKSCEPWFCL